MPPNAKPARPRLRFGRTGLAVDAAGAGHGIAGFADAVLRGVGQVIFVNNSYAGLLCLLGIFLGSPVQMLAALLCTAVGTAVGRLLGADREDVQNGLYGYNGCLVALAVPLFLGPGLMVWGLVLLATVLSSVLLRGMRSHGTFGLPALTAPFVLCTWMAVWTMRALVSVEASGPPAGSLRNVPVHPAGLLEGWPVIEGALTGIGQVYLQPGPVAGLAIALALLVASRPMFLLACLAGLASAATASLLALPEEAIRTGLFGFNAVLAALALGLVYQRPGVGSAVLAVVVALLMPAIQMACGYVLIRLGLPTMSVPFIMTTWLALGLLRLSGHLRPV